MIKLFVGQWSTAKDILIWKTYSQLGNHALLYFYDSHLSLFIFLKQSSVS